MQSDNLFDDHKPALKPSPLADRLRPKFIEEFYGQHDILSKNSILRNAILHDKVGNIIFSGPPGVGKTTLIEIISSYTRAEMIKLNAVLSGVKELRNEILSAEERWRKSQRRQFYSLMRCIDLLLFNKMHYYPQLKMVLSFLLVQPQKIQHMQ